jgi:hypothetical protein
MNFERLENLRSTFTHQLAVMIYFRLRDFESFSTPHNNAQLHLVSRYVEPLGDPTVHTHSPIFSVDSLRDFGVSRLRASLLQTTQNCQSSEVSSKELGMFNYKVIKSKVMHPPWDPNQLQCIAMDVDSFSTVPH